MIQKRKRFVYRVDYLFMIFLKAVIYEINKLSSGPSTLPYATNIKSQNKEVLRN